MAACNRNAMPNLQYSLLGNQHVIPLLGVVQTTSLLVVLIIADIVYRHNMPPIRDPVSYRPPFGMFLYKYLHLRLL